MHLAMVIVREDFSILSVPTLKCNIKQHIVDLHKNYFVYFSIGPPIVYSNNFHKHQIDYIIY